MPPPRAPVELKTANYLLRISIEVLSWFIPHAKSHPLVYTLAALELPHHPSRTHWLNGSWSRPTWPLRLTPIPFKAKSRTMVKWPSHCLRDMEASKFRWPTCDQPTSLYPPMTPMLVSPNHTRPFSMGLSQSHQVFTAKAQSEHTPTALGDMAAFWDHVVITWQSCHHMPPHWQTWDLRVPTLFSFNLFLSY